MMMFDQEDKSISKCFKQKPWSWLKISWMIITIRIARACRLVLYGHRLNRVWKSTMNVCNLVLMCNSNT